MTDVRAGAPVLAGPRRPAAAAGVAIGALLAAALALLPFAGMLAPSLGFAAFMLVAAVAVDRLAPHHPHARFGAGNTVTLIRAGGASVFVALALEPGLVAGSAGWVAFGGAALLLALDGVDGVLARRDGCASAFGARFDMEVDAFLILALSGLAFGLGKAGPWVLAIGLMRYAFVLAGRLAPSLARPLPPSLRRRTVCVVQVGVLALLLAPPVGGAVAGLLAAVALAALAWSFALDLAWLRRTRR
jgi:phosphatidylglycerophosphate synthase